MRAGGRAAGQELVGRGRPRLHQPRQPAAAQVCVQSAQATRSLIPPRTQPASACLPDLCSLVLRLCFAAELAGSTSIIFTRTCDSTRKIALTLRNLGFGAVPIHGQMSQPKRLGALNKFKARVAARALLAGVVGEVRMREGHAPCLRILAIT